MQPGIGPLDIHRIHHPALADPFCNFPDSNLKPPYMEIYEAGRLVNPSSFYSLVYLLIGPRYLLVPGGARHFLVTP